MSTYRVIPGQTLSGGGGAYLHTAGAGDVSPAFTGYDAECGWCWLGAPHSVAAHNGKVGQ